MRIIKFRIWDKQRKRMILEPNVSFPDHKGFFWAEPNVKGFRSDMEAGLMQFTGLLSASGQEIYEGDIIFRESYWEVLWSQNEVGMWGWMAWNEDTQKVYELDESILAGRVVGNIYEGPKLAKVK